MPENLFVLASELGKIVPSAGRELHSRLNQQLTPAQSAKVARELAAPLNIPLPQGQAKAKSGPMLRFVAGPTTPTPHSDYQPRPVQKHAAQRELQVTIKAISPYQVKVIMLEIVQRHRREARTIFLFICFFLILCLIATAIGVFMLLANETTNGAILTALGTFLSAIGAMLFKAYQDTNKNLDAFVIKVHDA